MPIFQQILRLDDLQQNVKLFMREPLERYPDPTSLCSAAAACSTDFRIREICGICGCFFF